MSDLIWSRRLVTSIARQALIDERTNDIFVPRNSLGRIICSNPVLATLGDKEVQRRVSAFCNRYGLAEEIVLANIIPALLEWFEAPIDQTLWESCFKELKSLAPTPAAISPPTQLTMGQGEAIVIADDDDDRPAEDTSLQLCAIVCAPVESWMQYVGRSAVELVAVLTGKDQHNQDLLAKVKTLQQTVRRQNLQLAELKTKEEADECALAIIHEENPHFSPQCAYSVAIRRNMSHVSTDAMGLVTLIGMSHQSVSRWPHAETYMMWP
jgi:hypothetical protein